MTINVRVKLDRGIARGLISIENYRLWMLLIGAGLKL